MRRTRKRRIDGRLHIRLCKFICDEEKDEEDEDEGEEDEEEEKTIRRIDGGLHLRLDQEEPFPGAS